MSKLKSIMGRLRFSIPRRGAKGGEDAPHGTTTPVHAPDAPFMRSINLLPDEFRPDTRRIRWNPAYVAAAGLIPIAIVAVALLYNSASEDADVAKAERDSIGVQVQTAQAELRQEAQEKGISALASVAGAELATTVHSGLAARIAWDRVIENVTRVMPEGLWTRSLQGGSASEDSDATEPGTLRIDGTSNVGQDEIAQFAARIKTLRDIEGVVLENTATTTINDQEVHEFTISATVKGSR